MHCRPQFYCNTVIHVHMHVFDQMLSNWQAARVILHAVSLRPNSHYNVYICHTHVYTIIIIRVHKPLDVWVCLDKWMHLLRHYSKLHILEPTSSLHMGERTCGQGHAIEILLFSSGPHRRAGASTTPYPDPPPPVAHGRTLTPTSSPPPSPSTHHLRPRPTPLPPQLPLSLSRPERIQNTPTIT